MLDTIFRGLFDSDITAVISVTDFLLCLCLSLTLGLLMAFVYMFRTRYTKSFVITLALLPAVVCVVIMMVNGNVGTGVAVAGAFSLVRFRSVPGSAKEICALFLAMGTGLIIGMGYLGFAMLFTAVMCLMLMVCNYFDFGAAKNAAAYKILTIMIPEDLDYTGIFDEIFKKYTVSYTLTCVKTTNMGSMFRLTYQVTLRDSKLEKEMIDKIRCRNAAETETGQTAAESSPDSSVSDNGDGSEASTVSADSEVMQTDDEMFTDRDYETSYDENSSVSIQLNGDSAEASSDSVEISGSTITITEESVYVISGTLDDGMIIVDAPDTAKIQLVLNGVTIGSETSAPIYILEADKVFVTLADGSENTLSNGGTFTAIDDSNIDAVIYSKQDLTLNGSGSLTVTSPAGHGIVSNDDLVITGGTYTVTSASQGLKANDSVRITGETSVSIDAGKDGIHVENDEDTSLGFVYISGGTLTIESEGDGISAGAYMQVSAGTLDILAGGGSENGSKESSDTWGSFGGGNPPGQRSGGKTTGASQTTAQTEDSDSSTSMKGLKAAGNLTILNGSITIDSADDAVHSNASVTISGGMFEISSGDDAVHADDTLTFTSGTINIAESYEGLEALHVDIQGGDIQITASDDGLDAAGGIDSSGTSGMAQTFSDSDQGVISVSAGSQTAGTEIILTDAGGSTVISYTPELDFSVIILSSPDIVSGETYTLTVGETSGEFEAD